MHSCQREAREFEVIERGPLPAIHVVALLAGHRESRRLVVGEAGLLKLWRVARNALNGKPLELARGSVLVAIVTNQGRVRADQGEPVFVTPDALQDDLPAAHRVTSRAVRSELSPVNVRMAIRALRADIGEYQAHMTLRAANTRVQPSQRKRCFVVIEFDNTAQRLPGRKGMTVLTGHFQIAVRTASCCRLGLTSTFSGGQSEQQKEAQECNLAHSDVHVDP